MGSSLGAGPPVLLTIVVMTTPALAQPPLAEVAREEKERRASISEKSRVYTNEDLRGGPGLTTGSPATPDQSAEPSPPEPAVAADDSPGDGAASAASEEEAWRERITSAREAKQRAELLVEALQNRVDSLWADFTARDDPFQRAQIERDRRAALAELERTLADVDRYDQEIRDIQEEARRAGAPPGWLR